MEFSFTASKSAGHIKLTPADGKTYSLPVAVLDMPLWKRYQELERKLSQAKRKAEETKNDEEVARITLENLSQQMSLLCPTIQDKHLQGFSITQLAEILGAMVKIAGGGTDARSEDEKKTTSVTPITSSRSRGRARRFA